LGSYLTDAYSGDVRCRKEVSERIVLRIYPLIVHPPNVVTIVAWAGAGKSTLVNHWLRRMAAEHYRSAELVFGWSFYRQGTSEGTSSAMFPAD
jgi:hypothetical protein